MTIQLDRAVSSVEVYDAEAARAALQERIRQEVQLEGAPRARVHLLADGWEETFDLGTMAKEQPAADVGATFQALRSRLGIERRFVVVQIAVAADDGEERRFAVLFEEILDAPRRWWVSLLPFQTDPATGLGHPLGPWQDSRGETEDPADLLPFLRPIAFPPAGAVAARFGAARGKQPDIRVRSGEIPPHLPPPADAMQLTELAIALALDGVLTGALKGTVVVRVRERSWQLWVLGPDQPADLEDMVRYVANRVPPAAEGVAIVVVAIRPQDDPPRPGVQIVAELGGGCAETWAWLAFPEGPDGPKHIAEWGSSGIRPVPEGGMWLGVDPMVLFDLGPPAP